MSIRKNVTNQQLLIFAFDKATLNPALGDAANITCNLRLDYGAAQATNTTNPTELEDGYYSYPLTQAETNANVIDVFPESSSSGIQVIGVPARVFTSPGDPTISLGLAISSRAQLELMFGTHNIAKWADLENDENATDVEDRITQAIAFATSDVYDRLRGGPVVVPISGDVPLGIVDATTRLAGVWLYENRGVNDAEKSKRGNHRLAYHADRAYAYLQKIRAGTIRSEAQSENVVEFPVSVRQT